MKPIKFIPDHNSNVVKITFSISMNHINKIKVNNYHNI